MAPRRPQDIGREAERMVASWLQRHGWPHAERRRMRGSADAGDLTGTPGVCWQVKGGQIADRPSDRRIADWLHELDDQRVNADAGWAVLICRRRGTSDPGRWWAWMSTADLVLTAGGTLPRLPAGPVCLHLETVAALLRQAGYGQEVAS